MFCLRVYPCTTCVPGVHEAQERVLDPLELALQTAVSCRGSAGIKPGSSGRAAGALNYRVISPAPLFLSHYYKNNIISKS